MQHTLPLYLTICLSTLALFACDPKEKTSPKKPAQKSSTKASTQTSPSKTVPSQTPPKTKPSKTMLNKASLDQQKAKSITLIFRKHIRDGRKSVHAKRYTDAMDHFKAALKLDPNNPRALSELGWAAFLGDKLDEAKDATTKAMGFTENINIKGASLYNLGRIAEKEKDQYAAALFYKRSLAVRPDNAQVQKRLKALVDAGVKVPNLTDSCAFTPLKGKNITLKTLCSTYTKGKVSKDSPHTCEDSGAYPKVKVDDKTMAVIFAYDEEDDFTKTYVMAIQRNDKWYVHPLDSEYNPGAFGISESYKIETFKTQQLLPDAPLEILLNVHHERFDTDLGINEYETSEYRFTSVVSLAKEVPEWVLELETQRKYERDILHTEDKIDEDFKHTKDIPIKRHVGVKVAFEPKGKITVSKTKDVKPNNKLGTFDITAFRQKCLAQ